MAWTINFIIPKLKNLASRETNYLARLTALFSVNKLVNASFEKSKTAGGSGPELLHQHLLPIVFELEADKVPNVRFNVAKTINGLRHALDQNDSEKMSRLERCLKKLDEDDDEDVTFYARQALERYSEMGVAVDYYKVQK